MPGIRAEELEDAVTRAVVAERIDPATLDLIDHGIAGVLADLQATERQTRDALTRQLAKLAQQEARLVDALADGDLPVPQIREKLQSLMLQKGAVEERLALTNEHLCVGADRARAAVDLLREPGRLYRALPEPSRRELIQALFRRLYAQHHRHRDPDGKRAHRRQRRHPQPVRAHRAHGLGKQEDPRRIRRGS